MRLKITRHTDENCGRCMSQKKNAIDAESLLISTLDVLYFRKSSDLLEFLQCQSDINIWKKILSYQLCLHVLRVTDSLVLSTATQRTKRFQP